ncbi:MAG: hypothetical protein AAF411_01465 [Myxococcota bacterium]
MPQTRLVALLLIVGACYFDHPRPRGRRGAVELSQPGELCAGPRVRDCRSHGQASAELANLNNRLLHAAPTPGGSQGAAVVTMETPQGVIFDAKWRPLAARSRFSDPIAELASERLQRLLLEPTDYVVPPTEVGCLERERYRMLRHRVAERADRRCIVGTLSYWLPNVLTLDDARLRGFVPDPSKARDARPHGDAWLYEPRRFRRDARYRRNIAHLNLLAYLMEHGDAHDGQFVVSASSEHVFLVDNSVAFGMGRRRTMEGRQDFSRWVVPSIPRDTADRLRVFVESDLRSLRVIAEFEGEGSRLRLVPAGSAFGSPEARLRERGGRLQLGLRQSEVEAIRSRARDLFGRVRRGEVRVFDP